LPHIELVRDPTRPYRPSAPAAAIRDRHVMIVPALPFTPHCLVSFVPDWCASFTRTRLSDRMVACGTAIKITSKNSPHKNFPYYDANESIPSNNQWLKMKFRSFPSIGLGTWSRFDTFYFSA
jgi:hypothetical protein